jgi:hypothetical protein
VRCLVLEVGANVHQFANGIYGYTLLFLAAFGGHLDVAKCLVKEFGANVNQRNKDGATSLLMYMATKNVRLNVLRYMLKEVDVDVKQADHAGATPLYFAAEDGNLDVVRCLVTEFGARVNQANSNGVTPLCIAAPHLHFDVVRCLITDVGADVNQATQDGVTVLMLAARLELPGPHQAPRSQRCTRADCNERRRNGDQDAPRGWGKSRTWRCGGAAPTRAVTAAGGSATLSARRRGTAESRVRSCTGPCIGCAATCRSIAMQNRDTSGVKHEHHLGYVLVTDFICD